MFLMVIFFFGCVSFGEWGTYHVDRPLGPGIEVLKKIVWLSIVDLTAENLGKKTGQGEKVKKSDFEVRLCE